MDKKKNLVIGALLAAIVLMSVGYAALAQTLNINGTANIDASWGVEVTSITEGTLTGAETVTTSFTGESATFEVDLKYPGATATYNVAIKNTGSIDAILESINGISAVNAAEPVDVQYEITGVATGTELAAGATNTATVKVTWLGEATTIPETKTKTATITLHYVQNTD